MAGQEFTARAMRRSVLSGTRATHPTPPVITVQSAKTVVVHIAMEAITGTSITFSIWEINPVTGRLKAAATLATAAMTAAGYATLTIGPGVATVANAALSTIAPKQFNITPTGTFSSANYDVSVELID